MTAFQRQSGTRGDSTPYSSLNFSNLNWVVHILLQAMGFKCRLNHNEDESTFPVPELTTVLLFFFQDYIALVNVNKHQSAISWQSVTIRTCCHVAIFHDNEQWRVTIEHQEALHISSRHNKTQRHKENTRMSKFKPAQAKIAEEQKLGQILNLQLKSWFIQIWPELGSK